MSIEEPKPVKTTLEELKQAEETVKKLRKDGAPKEQVSKGISPQPIRLHDHCHVTKMATITLFRRSRICVCNVIHYTTHVYSSRNVCIIIIYMYVNVHVCCNNVCIL